MLSASRITRVADHTKEGVTILLMHGVGTQKEVLRPKDAH